MIQLNSIKKSWYIYTNCKNFQSIPHFATLWSYPANPRCFSPANQWQSNNSKDDKWNISNSYCIYRNYLSKTCFSLTNGFRWKHYTSYIIARLCKLRSQIWLLSSRKVHITFISFLGEWLFTWQASMLFKNMKSEFFTS